MTNHNRQFDDLERPIPERFHRDLRSLFEPPSAVPSQTDNIILGEARRRFVRPRPLIIRLRWAAGVAAAAAVLALGVILYRGPVGANREPSAARYQSAATDRADIDGNGRVDILDAFRLARSVESRTAVDARWDLNGDGRVDRADVDLVARAAVRLGPNSQAHRGRDGDSRTRTVALGAAILPLRREAISDNGA